MRVSSKHDSKSLTRASASFFVLSPSVAWIRSTTSSSPVFRLVIIDFSSGGFLAFPSVFAGIGHPNNHSFFGKTLSPFAKPLFLTCFRYPQFFIVLERKLQGVQNRFPPFAPTPMRTANRPSARSTTTPPPRRSNLEKL